MPRIGNVEVSDDVVASLSRAGAAAPERPGFGAVLSGAAQSAYGQARYGLPYQAAKLTGTLTPEAEAEYQAGLATANVAAQAAPAAGIGDVTSGKVGIGRFLGENVAAMLPSMVGMVGGGIIGGARGGGTGAIVGGILGGIPQFSASNVARAVEENGALSDRSAAMSLAVAAPQSAADAAITRFLPGAGKVLGDLAAHQSGGFLTRTAKSMLEAAGTEAVTEAGQQFGERYAAGLPVSDADAAGEYVNAAVTAFAIGGLLGAGGGFRRTNAVAKSPGEVTNEDIKAHVDGILDGSLRALPAPSPENRAPGDVGAISPPPQVGRDLDFIVDAQGRAVAPDQLGGTADETSAILANLPREGEPAPPTAEELFARLQQNLTQPAVPDMLAAPQPAFGEFVPPATDTSVAALTGTQPTGVLPVEAPLPTRPFAGVDIADLNKARKAKNADPAIVTQITAELDARKAEDPFNGVPMNQDIVKLRGVTPDEQIAGVRALLENGDSRAGTMKLAERLGIDLNAPEVAPVEAQAPIAAAVEPALPTPVTPEIAEASLPAVTPEVAPSSVAPVIPVAPEVAPVVAAEPAPTPLTPPRMTPQVTNDPEFAAQWEKLKTDAGIQRMRSGADALTQTPANLVQAQAQVFQSLATDPVGRGNEPTQAEKMARKMGLITDDDAMDITPLGRQAFLATPEGFTETVNAAQQQGYTGAAASIFDRGVQAQIAGETAAPTFTDFNDLAAFQAGKVWSKDFIENAETRTAAQTDAIRGRQGARATANPTPRQELSPQQVRVRTLNNLIDSADLSDVADQEVVQLRRLAAAGASADEVGKAIQALQGGESIRPAPPARPEARPIDVRRRQPVFKEMNTPDAAPGREANRTETEAAVKAFDVRNLIEFAKAEGGITEARAAKLHDLLDRGNVDAVKNSLKDFDPDAAPKRRLPTPPERVDVPDAGGRTTGAADAKFEAGIDGKDVDGVLDYMIEQAPSKYHREMMRKVKASVDTLRKAGIAIDVQIVRPGDAAPVVLNNPTIRAFAVSTLKPPATKVYLKSSEMGTSSGMNFQLAAHELLHAVTARSINYGRQTPDTKLGKDVKDLVDLGNAIISHFNQRFADGKLTDFEKAYYERQHNALANVDEILAWGMTNPDMQRYLQSIEYKPRQSVFGRMVELLRNLLGLDGKYDTALTELLRVSERIMAAGVNDMRSSYAMNNPEGLDTAVIESPALDAAPRTPRDADATVSSFVQQAGAAFDKAAATNFVSTSRDSVRKFGLGMFSRNHIDNLYGEMIPGVVANTHAREARVATRNLLQLVGENVIQAIDKLRQSGEAGQAKDHARINNLMQAAQYGVDGARTWEKHSHLHEEPNVANLKAIWEQAREDYSNLARHGTVGLFEEARAANVAQNYGQMLGQLYERVVSDEQYRVGVAGSEVSPADTLLDTEGLTSAKALRDHLGKELDSRIAAAKAYLATQSTAAASLTAKDRTAVEARTASLGSLLDEISKNRTNMDERPYFHLPRFGDHFAAFTIAKDKDGNVDKAALKVVADALEKLGVADVQLSTDNTNPRVMIRTDNKSTAELMGQLGKQLEGRGVVERDTTLYGPRSREDNYGLGGRVPDYISQALERVDTDPAFQPDPSMSRAEKEAMQAQLSAAKQALVDGWLDMQPSNSISKVLAKRKNVQGASEDMIRGFAHRQNVGAVGISALLTRPKFSDALRSMRATVEESHEAGNTLDPYITSQVVNEIRRRDADMPVNEVADSFDKVRAIANTSYLGLNPSSALINMTALGTTVLPELAKKSGYVKSFHAMRRASVQAASILSTAFADAQSRGAGHRADLSLTEGVLAKANLPNDVREFIRKRVAAGDIDLATMARSLGQISAGKTDGKLDQALRYGSAFNLYSESFARLVGVIAARELHGTGNSDEAHAYARGVVKESLMSFGPGDTARHLGKNGLLGPVTPLVTQFMQWNVQVTEKLFREFRDGIGKQRPGETAETAAARRAGSQKFIAGHLTAITALAGSLGLPFASVFAAAIEKIFGDDDDPFDATAEYRNFLASVMGKDVGEVLAHGLPRAFGFDISRRAGEQDLFPGSEILANKGTWTEAVQNSTGRSIGAAPNMILSVLDGGSQIARGDVMSGMKAILPVALKNPIEAYRMSTEGYVDTKGNKLPLTPGAAEIMWQLVGFAPSEKAEYSEARGDQSSRNKQLSTRAGKLRQGIVRALRSGDEDGAKSLINDAIEFDSTNPTFAVIPSISSALQRQTQDEAQARAMKMPLGVSMKDVAGQQLTGYANFGNGM